MDHKLKASLKDIDSDPIDAKYRIMLKEKKQCLVVS